MRTLSQATCLALLLLACGNLRLLAQANAPTSRESVTISAGVTVDQAIVVLERNGCNRPFGLSWAKPGFDRSIRAFQIDEGVVLALIYNEADKSIVSLQMVITPPDRVKGNDRMLAVRRITFEPDGTYVLHLSKQEKKQPDNSALPTPQLPTFPKNK